jgi:hypothetical protein
MVRPTKLAAFALALTLALALAHAEAAPACAPLCPLASAHPAPARRQRRTSAAAAAAAAAAARSGDAPPMATIFVATTGSDAQGDGSAARPFASMERARVAVRTVLSRGPPSGDIDVVFAAGTYVLAAPVVFSAADGAGGDTFSVRYAAEVPGALVVFSGGSAVAGPWAPTAGEAWVAAFDGAPSRQLFVGGVRAAPAALDAQAFSTATSAVTDAGYVVHDASLAAAMRAAWAAQPGGAGALEFVYTGVGKSWTEARCRVASLGNGAAGSLVINMTQPCWAKGRAFGGTRGGGGGSGGALGAGYPHALSFPVSIANAYAGLKHEGSAYLSQTEIFYVPRSGDNMSTVAAVVPQLEQLVVVAGDAAAAAPVVGLSFVGLEFAHTTWLFPNSGEGYVDDQAGVMHVGAVTNASTPAMMPTPAAVAVRGGVRVLFAGCTFRSLGSVALSIGGGSKSCAVANSSFFDISGGAISLGEIDNAVAAPALQDEGHVVFNNDVSDLPVEYHGCGAIVAFYVANTTIAHNSVADASCGSIEMGWGWGAPAFSARNAVLANRVVNSNYMLTDTGSIYVNGANAGGSVVSHNYLANQTRKWGALYADGASANWIISENVCDNNVVWADLDGVPNQMVSNISLVNNFFGPLSLNRTVCVHCEIEGNVFVPAGTPWPAAARLIMDAAGNVD